jgi:hypothetical protein
MCNGQTHHVKDLESKWAGESANKFDVYLQVTIKWPIKSDISDKIK